MKMKKSALALIFLITVLLTVSGCGRTTITQHEANHVYKAGEWINITDIDTGDDLGRLKMTDVKVLKDKPFTVREEVNYDDEGNAIYGDVEYAQLIQVFFKFDSNDYGKTLSYGNFMVYDSLGSLGYDNPDTEYKSETRNGEKSLILALENKSDSIEIGFTYNVLQFADTAKIKMDF